MTNFCITEYLVSLFPHPTWRVCAQCDGSRNRYTFPHICAKRSNFTVIWTWAHQTIFHSLWWRNFLFHLVLPRFKSKLVRRLASFSFIIRNCLTLGITVYTPCVALNIIAGIPYWASLSTMTLLTIMFTITVSQLNSEHTEVANGVAFECLHSQTTYALHAPLSRWQFYSLLVSSVYPSVGRIKSSNYGRCNTRTDFASGLYFCDNSRSIWNWQRWKSLHDQQR